MAVVSNKVFSGDQNIIRLSHKNFFDGSKVQLGYKYMEDWYRVTKEDIRKNGGEGLLRGSYNGSPSTALRSVYPEHNWDLERFKNKPRKFWEETRNQKKFFDKLYVQLGHKTMDDWYNVTVDEFYKYGGGGLLGGFNNSPSLALQCIYPSHNWMPWRFKTVSRGYWHELVQDQAEIRRMIDWLSDRLSIQNLDDWYRISLEQINGWIHITSAKDLLAILRSAYPQHKWHDKSLLKTGFHIKASQHEAHTAVRRLFPTHG